MKAEPELAVLLCCSAVDAIWHMALYMSSCRELNGYLFACVVDVKTLELSFSLLHELLLYPLFWRDEEGWFSS